MAKEPKLGNIRSGGQIVGYRDWISKEFVPIVEGWALVSDNACENNPLVTHEQIAVTHLGEFVDHTEA
jgi:hypothetical protein